MNKNVIIIIQGQVHLCLYVYLQMCAQRLRQQAKSERQTLAPPDKRQKEKTCRLLSRASPSCSRPSVRTPPQNERGPTSLLPPARCRGEKERRCYGDVQVRPLSTIQVTNESPRCGRQQDRPRRDFLLTVEWIIFFPFPSD